MMMRPAACSASLLFAVLIPAQQVADAKAERVGLELVRSVPFDGQALPRLAAVPGGHSLRALFVQADGARVLLDLLGAGATQPEPLAEPAAGEQPAKGEPANGEPLGGDPRRGSGPRLLAVGIADGAVADLTPVGGAQLVGSTGAMVLLQDSSRVFPVPPAEFRALVVPRLCDVRTAPDGSRAIVSAVDRTAQVRLWHFASDLQRTLASACHASAVGFGDNGVTAIARASFVAGGGESSEGILVVDARGNRLRELPAQPQGVTALAIAPDGEELFVVAGGVRRLAMADGRVLAGSNYAPRFWAVLDANLAVSHDGAAVKFHDTRTLQVVKEFPIDVPDAARMPASLAQQGTILAAALSADRRLLAVATFGELRLLRIRGLER